MANTNTGRFLLKGKKSNPEIEQFEALIRKKPDDDRAHVRLAELYARAGNEDKAIELYEKAAILFEKKGFLNKAKAVLKQALMLNPEHGKINVLLADYDRQSGLIKDATIRYNTAVGYYAKMGNKLAAINILRKMVELYPGNINFTVKLANTLVSEKMNHEAAKILLPVAESLKGTDKANEYANVLKLLYTATDGDSSVGRDLVNLYLKNASYTNALAVLQTIMVNNHDNLEFLEKLAFVFEKLGETKKFVAISKQIASVCGDKQNYSERDSIYRKILEIDPNDREALSALNETGKLRDIISDKIDSSMAGIDENQENDGHIDLVLDIDIDDESHKHEEEVHYLDLETAVKEAGVFLSYRLFSKAIDKIQSSKEWQDSPEAIDILIQANIELGEVETAGDLVISLIDLNVERGNIASAKELLVDAESMLAPGDQRILTRKEKVQQWRSTLDDDIEKDNVFEGIPDVHPEEIQDKNTEAPEVREEEPFELPISDEPSDFENLTKDILSELREPPQDRLDELEFYISIEDFVSATQLLQELLVNYPDSAFLSGLREILPIRKEDDLSSAMEDMKNVLEDDPDEENHLENLYDMATSHLSMGMFSEAITLFNKVLDSEPSNIGSMIGLSQAWSAAGKVGKAIEMLKKASKLTEDSETLSAIKEQIDEWERSQKTKSKKKGG